MPLLLTELVSVSRISIGFPELPNPRTLVPTDVPRVCAGVAAKVARARCRFTPDMRTDELAMSSTSSSYIPNPPAPFHTVAISRRFWSYTVAFERNTTETVRCYPPALPTLYFFSYHTSTHLYCTFAYRCHFKTLRVANCSIPIQHHTLHVVPVLDRQYKERTHSDKSQ